MKLKKKHIPSGTIISFSGGIIPSGYLPCDGSALSRDVYSALFQAIGTSHGNGDGSTTFHLPDYRGRFLRGSDNMGTGAANRDPDAASRTASNAGGNSGGSVGSAQSDSIQNIAGGAYVSDVGVLRTNEGVWGAFYANGSCSYQRGYAGGAGYGLAFDASRAVRASTETRPQNVNINYIIKI